MERQVLLIELISEYMGKCVDQKMAAKVIISYTLGNLTPDQSAETVGEVVTDYLKALVSFKKEN